MSLMVSISGIRGVIGESLTPEVAVRYAAAFGEYCKRTDPKHPAACLGRDGRITGKALADIITSTLLSCGVDVRDLGICPTPTVQLAVEHERASGGISVTASHNPMQWNGMKFIAPTGMFLDADENRVLWDLAEKPRTYAPWDAMGRHIQDGSWIRKHIESVLALDSLNVGIIRKRKLKVVLDCVDAAGGVIIPALLRELGCSVIEMHCSVSGIFSHTPEPIPENLTGLATRVASERADLGIAVDPDVDRLVLITERGEPFGEEYTIASATQFALGRAAQRPGLPAPVVVVNLSTTRAVDDIASRFGARVVRTAVGEINVAKKMKEIGALIGGEGSGGVILPAVHLGRDASVGIGLVLQLLAESGGTLSALKASLPQYAIAKGRMSVAGLRPDDILARIAERHRNDGRINTEDGLKIDFPQAWVHLRKSNTEPIIRIIAEGATMEEALRTVEAFRKEIPSTT